MLDPIDDRRKSAQASGDSKPLELADFTVAVQSGAADGPPLELAIDPGDASADEIAGLLIALSDLHVAAGGLGLTFTIKGMLGSAVLMEARPISVPEVITVNMRSEEMNAILELGRYANPTQLIQHSFVVTWALLRLNEIEPFMRRGVEMEPFDLLELDSEIRRVSPGANESSPEDCHHTEIQFPRPEALEPLMRLGEFSSVEQCLEVTLNVLARILISKSEGYELVGKVGDEMVPIELPNR